MSEKSSSVSRLSRLFLVLVGAAWVALSPVGAHAAQGDCGQPVTNGGAPTATDCLYILKSAVGAQSCTPECVCDVNNAGGVTATDALTCLKKAVGQNVTLDCGPGCTGTTTTTLPPVLTTEFVVFTKKQGSYATADLAGTWDVSALATGQDSPYWSRGSLTVQSNGNFSGSISDFNGANDSLSGKLALSATGIITCTTNQCPIQFRGAMDAGKTFMAITYTWDDGTTELLLGTKRGASYAQSDVAATWEINSMLSTQGAPYWVRGALTAQANGAASGDLTTSEGGVQSISLTLNLSGNGAMTCPSGCSPDTLGAMDSGKTIVTLTYSYGGGGAYLMVMCRKAESYAQSDMAGTWEVNTLVSGLADPLWTRGSIVTQPNGAFSGSLIGSDGGNDNVAGTFTLSSTGVVTLADDLTFRCVMDADKTVVVCTNTW
jgi:hypothetical protein